MSNSPQITKLRKEFIEKNWELFQENGHISDSTINAIRNYCGYSEKTGTVDIRQAINSTVRQLRKDGFQGRPKISKYFVSETKCRRCGHMTEWGHFEAPAEDVEVEYKKYYHEQQVKSVDLATVGERNSSKLWGIMADPSISKETFDRLCELYDEICYPINRGNYPVRIDINYV